MRDPPESVMVVKSPMGCNGVQRIAPAVGDYELILDESEARWRLAQPGSEPLFATRIGAGGHPPQAA